MANELIHASQGTTLTQAEFEAVGLHVCNSQATGDLIYASSATQLTRLGIGSTNAILTVIGGVPTWQSTLAGLTLTSPTINGTIATIGLTLPAVTLGGAVNANSQLVTNLYSIAADGTNIMSLYANQASNNAAFRIYTTGATPNFTNTRRLEIRGGLDTVTAEWLATTQVGLVLGGNMTVTGYAFDAGAVDVQVNTTGNQRGLVISNVQDSQTGATLKLIHNSASIANTDRPALIDIYARDGAGALIQMAYQRWNYTNVGNGTEVVDLIWALTNAGAVVSSMSLTGGGALNVLNSYYVASTKVVGARVVDARCDDVINSGDATTDGVIDSLRDAMITHGLIAAA